MEAQGTNYFVTANKGVPSTVGAVYCYLTDESGNYLTDESGNRLVAFLDVAGASLSTNETSYMIHAED